jgi:predicted dinucleotide-binding enzyme
MKIVVIGGTGLIGSKIVEKLKQKGHEAIAAAPSTGHAAKSCSAAEGLSQPCVLILCGGRSSGETAMGTSKPGIRTEIIPYI